MGEAQPVVSVGSGQDALSLSSFRRETDSAVSVFPVMPATGGFFVSQPPARAAGTADRSLT